MGRCRLKRRSTARRGGGEGEEIAGPGSESESDGKSSDGSAVLAASWAHTRLPSWAKGVQGGRAEGGSCCRSCGKASMDSGNARPIRRPIPSHSSPGPLSRRLIPDDSSSLLSQWLSLGDRGRSRGISTTRAVSTPAEPQERENTTGCSVEAAEHMG